MLYEYTCDSTITATRNAHPVDLAGWVRGALYTGANSGRATPATVALAGDWFKTVTFITKHKRSTSFIWYIWVVT